MGRKTSRTEQQVGSYRLLRLIGEGGMGQVFEAIHVDLGRRAALKLLRPELALDAETAVRFFNEARAASLVQHPGLVHIYEYGDLDDGGAYIVMEYVQGELLRDRITRSGGRLSATQAVPLARQIAVALQAAHAQGIVHRDLKPDNVKIVPDEEVSLGERAKILDFGIAKMLTPGAKGGTPQTRQGQILGTPEYMAPEQAGAPGGIGPHTDVYALGVVLYEMLCGRPPFVAEEALQLIGQHLFATPPRLRAGLPDVDLALDELLQRMLAKSPDTRPAMPVVASELAKIDSRLRSNASGLITIPEDHSQADTFVFRKINSVPKNSSILTRSTRTNKKRLLIGGGAAILLFAILAGRSMIVKKPQIQGANSLSNNPPDHIAERKPISSPIGAQSNSPSKAPPTPLPTTAKGPSPEATKQRNPEISSPAPKESKQPSVNPNDVTSVLQRAQIAITNGENRKAIEIAMKVQSRSPTQAWRIIGTAACQEKDIKLANDAYGRLDPPGQQYMAYACKRIGIGRTSTTFQIEKR